MKTNLLIILLISIIVIVIYIKLFHKYYELFEQNNNYNKSDERIIDKTTYNEKINNLNTYIDMLNGNITNLQSINKMNFNKINDLKENIDNISTNFKIDETDNLFQNIKLNINTIYKSKKNNTDPDNQLVI